MSSYFYETLGRVTWIALKRQVKGAIFGPPKPVEAVKKSRKGLIAGVSILAAGVIVAGGLIARSSSSHS
jgi:hypothetical protein